LRLQPTAVNTVIDGDKSREAPASPFVFLRHLYAIVLDMSPEQCRTARILLDWTPADLARAAGVSVITVRNFEAGKVAAGRLAPILMRRALEGAGIRFSAGEGAESVRLDT
jgi:DNA-binding transcriptional regulator YiaG